MKNNNPKPDRNKFDLSKDMFSLSELWVNIKRLAVSNSFSKFYLWFSLLTLTTTTFIWSLLGARLQNSNSDQLANAYLFNNSAVFHAASMPDQHSFLIKWPIFWLIKQFGYSPSTFIAFTVLLSLITVGSLAYLIYRIDKRQLVFGTLCLALASVLLMIPAMPYAGGLLPSNMAMITTRNIEYILYILSLVFILHNARQRGRVFWSGIIVLAALVASDKLFLTLSLASGLISAVFYAAVQRKQLFIKSIRWLAMSVIAMLIATFSLWVINVQVTNMANTSVAGPYGLVTAPHKIVIGSVYAVMAVFTNFGANPAYDSLNIRDIAHTAFHRLSGIESISFIVNGLILLAAIFAILHLIRKVINHHTAEEYLSHSERVTTLMLIWTSVAAIGAFIFTDHYYPVDSRYLGITLFAGFLALATMLSSYKISNRKILPLGFIILISITIGTPYSINTYHHQQDALALINERNQTVAQILQKHHVKTLVGDYWRVLPIELMSKNKVSVSPLDACTKERTVLNSQLNHVNLDKSFAYLLSFDRGLTDYPQCNLDSVFKAYGRPNSSVVIEGSLKSPKELLLFYDLGANKSGPSKILSTPSTVLPISIDRLPNRACQAKTIMNIVAHEDDDLLFMNPDMLHDIAAGNCVRTVYLTAGDAGASQFYWLSRQKGLEVAYSYMNGTPGDLWIERIVEVSADKFVTVANPRNNSKISLIFMHLPDGNLFGQGFVSYANQSLNKLLTHRITALDTVDKQSTYDLNVLTNTLTTLMTTYKVNELRTQSDYVTKQFQDHSDHIAVGKIATIAFNSYHQNTNVSAKIVHYIGYPIRSMPDNVSGEDLTIKENAFFIYSKFAGAECTSEALCSQIKTYSSYLKHQYQNPN